MHSLPDEIDLRAMRLLVTQGRMTWAELAHHLDLSGPATAERVRRLEERGFISGYGALLDRNQLGYGLTAFVGVDLANATHRTSFLSRMKLLPEVLECHHVTGDHDYLLKIACRSPLHVDQLINESIKVNEEVVKTRVLIVLGSPKESLFAPPDAAV